MFKKRTRPQSQTRERESSHIESDSDDLNEEEKKLPLAELLELRKLRKNREGIDVAKLNKGDTKKKRKRPEDGVEDTGGLRQGAPVEDEETEQTEAKARRAVRNNNFTQQTNALDVDKHMMAYIEENLKIRSRLQEEEEASKAKNPQDELYKIGERWREAAKQKEKEEGNVTNSVSMLTAIPEVDLGMDARLKNIEETEKAKRDVAEVRHEKKKLNRDEEHLVAQRFYRPNLRAKSDADILRDAKLEAMGLPPQDDVPRHRNNKPQVATDEAVMERFKKRMRK